MRFLGNVLWLIFGGLEMAILTFLEGIILCITIIFIPVGVQMFQVSGFLIWPMGKKVVPAQPNGFKTVLNVIWCILGGIWNALAFLIIGCIFCITIIGIPFGLQFFKLAKFTLMPLGHNFARVD